MFSPVSKQDRDMIFAVTGGWVLEYIGNRPFTVYVNDLGQRFVKFGGDWFLWCPLAGAFDVEFEK